MAKSARPELRAPLVRAAVRCFAPGDPAEYSGQDSYGGLPAHSPARRDNDQLPAATNERQEGTGQQPESPYGSSGDC